MRRACRMPIVSGTCGCHRLGCQMVENRNPLMDDPFSAFLRQQLGGPRDR
jgi:hypothetical protein